MKSKTIQFDQVVLDGEGVDAEASIVSQDVPVLVDEESVQFALPSGAKWACDKGDLTELLTGGAAISLDRAKSIAEAAVDANLARWDENRDGALTISTALREKLTEVGVEKIAELKLGRAEAVEAFIAQKAALRS